MIYTRLFTEVGRPLVLKTDNGGPLRDDETKRLLAEQEVLPLFSPKRCPRYNGGVERANGQLAGYQQAVAEFRGRRAGPTCADVETARRLANELSRPEGWRGPTASTLWANRPPLSAAERSAFLARVAGHRAEVRGQWQFAIDAALTHDQAAAIDRHAIRDALVEQDLLRIHPRRGHKTTQRRSPSSRTDGGAGILPSVPQAAPPPVGGAADCRPHVVAASPCNAEEAHYSTNKPPASGQE